MKAGYMFNPNILLSLFFWLACFLSNLILAQDSANPRGILYKHKQNLHENFQKQFLTESSVQNQLDALYYKLELDISFNPNFLNGRVTNRYKSKINDLSFMEIDLDNNLGVSAVEGPVSSYSHANQKLFINLNQVFNQDDIIEITVSYSGIPNAGSGRWFVFDSTEDTTNHVWTLSEPYGAKYWWPCKDYPSDKADSADIIVTVPENQLVASNGILQSILDDGFGKRTFHWKEKYPIATYLISLAIAPYAHFTDVYSAPGGEQMLLDYYVYPEFETEARRIFPAVKDHLDALSHYFGPYPFLDEKYGMAQFGWGGAMEHQTISSIGRVHESWDYVYVHELGHHWFGDALTCATWKDIWLNEGFASYSEALYAEWAGHNGFPPGKEAYKSYMLSQYYLEGGTITIQDTTEVANIFNRIVYDKGSWLLHMLRGVLGDEYFFEALYNYANGNLKYSSVTTNDFKNVCESVSGISLDTFFDQWLNYEYYPHYKYEWQRSDNSLHQVQVKIIQSQNDIVYEMPVSVRFVFNSGGDTVVTVMNYQREQTYFISLNDIPVEMIFDPDNWILKNTEDLSVGEFTSEITVKSIFPNPARNHNTVIVKHWGSSSLKLNIFDITGRLVNELEPFYQSGQHEYFFNWDTRDRSGVVLASGMYFIQPLTNTNIAGEIRKVLLIK
jgi:aminopeptidase N